MVDPSALINYIQLNAAVIKAAKAEIDALRAAQKKQAEDEQAIEAAIEKAADALIGAGHLVTANRPAAIRSLRDPVRALAFVERLARQKVASPTAIGEPVAAEKQASSNEIFRPKKSAADEAFERGLRGLVAFR
jgi:hypothetical protein